MSIALAQVVLFSACAPAVPAPSSPPAAAPAAWSRHDLGADGPMLRSILTGGPGYIGLGQAGGSGGDGGAAVWSSTDGLTWTSVGPPVSEGSFADAVAAGPGFVGLVAPPASVWTSTDGLAWSEADLVGDTEQTLLLALAARDGAIVAVGQREIWTSADGQTWERADVPAGNATINDVAVGGPGFVAVGSELVGSMEAKGAVWTSADGRTWERLADQPMFEKADLRAIAADASGIVATGWATDPERGLFFTPTAWSSTNGNDWRRATVRDDLLPSGGSPQGALEGAVMMSLARGPHGWVSAGTALEAAADAMAVDAAIWTSVDGATWDRVPHTALFEAGVSSAMEFGAVSVTAASDRVVVVGRTSGPQTTLWITPAQPGGSTPTPRSSEPEPSGDGGGGIDATPAPPLPGTP